jgi:pantothenate synthetase
MTTKTKEEMAHMNDMLAMEQARKGHFEGVRRGVSTVAFNLLALVQALESAPGAMDNLKDAIVCLHDMLPQIMNVPPAPPPPPPRAGEER